MPRTPPAPLTGRGFREGFRVEHAEIPAGQRSPDPALNPKNVAVLWQKGLPFRAKNEGFSACAEKTPP